MIREMVEKDYEQLEKLVYQVHELHCKNRPDIYVDGNPLPREFFNKILNDENSFNYVYEEDNNIYGVLLAMKEENKVLPIAKKRITYFIEDIVVDKNYRRKGIGKQLYYFLKEKAMEDNVDSIELNVWAFNEKAIKFYEALGMSVKNMKLEQVLNNDTIETQSIELKITSKVD